MNRETELRFSEIPEITKPRSKFKRPYTHKTTFNAGNIIPIYLDQDILPGDTVKINMSSVVRMITPIYPVMDNAYMDVMFFFVPTRLVWEHWREFWGENTNAWYQTVEYEIPQLKTKYDTVTQQDIGFFAGTVADYMGLPTDVAPLSVSALPCRAYVKIWNDWFRDENLQQEAPNTTGDADTELTLAYAYTGGMCLKANKYHDYFTSALPAPLKSGAEVLLPLGSRAPVLTYTDDHETNKQSGNFVPLHTAFTTTGAINSNRKSALYMGTTNTNGIGAVSAKTGDADGVVTSTGVYPTNLWTDLTSATAARISQLRQAFAIQRFFEAQARGGSRYIEFVKNIFGVTSPDARLQRSEYLGGKRILINMQQVVQTSSTDAASPQGNTAGFSHTITSDEYFTKSFTEHGILLGLACVRTDHTYSQGIERGWSRKKWTDFYVPQFANLSEQAILNKEIYAQGNSVDDQAFGYQEAWAEYRYKPSNVTGLMRPTHNLSLDAWHYGDEYNSLPVLGSTWIKETPANIDRTLAIQSSLRDEHQFIADFFFDCTYVRTMPLYSVPGLLDHM